MKTLNKKFIIISLFLALVLALPFVLSGFSNSVSVSTRTINVSEIGTLSYEEKIEKIKSEFDSYEIDDQENFTTFTAEIKNISYLSSDNNDSEVKEQFSSCLNKIEETISISNSLIVDGEKIEENNQEFTAYYDEILDTVYLVDSNGNKIDILKEFQESNKDECFFLTALITALTIKQIVAIVVVTVVAATIVVVATSPTIQSEIKKIVSGAIDKITSVWEKLQLKTGKITATKLNKSISLTPALAVELYEQVKNKKNCYLLCGTITGNAPIPIEYKLTNLENASNWVNKGGSVWSPYSTTAEACIIGAGFMPGGLDKVTKTYMPYIAEIHNLSSTVGFSFCHYHSLQGNVRIPLSVHSFFGLPVYDNFEGLSANLI